MIHTIPGMLSSWRGKPVRARATVGADDVGAGAGIASRDHPAGSVLATDPMARPQFGQRSSESLVSSLQRGQRISDIARLGAQVKCSLRPARGHFVDTSLPVPDSVT